MPHTNKVSQQISNNVYKLQNVCCFTSTLQISQKNLFLWSTSTRNIRRREFWKMHFTVTNWQITKPPEIYNINLIMRQYRKNANWGTVYKITLIFKSFKIIKVKERLKNYSRLIIPLRFNVMHNSVLNSFALKDKWHNLSGISGLDRC